MSRLKALWIVLTDGRTARNVVEDRRIDRLIQRDYPHLWRWFQLGGQWEVVE